MKKLYIKAIAALLLGGSAVSCGDDFLDSKLYDGFDINEGLTSVNRVHYALNGCYDRLFRYYFAGNYATSFGDIGSDITYWNQQTNHFTDIYRFTPTADDTYLYYIWNYGYKVCDNSARVIEAGEALLDKVEGDELKDLQMYLAEAHALRAYGHFYLVNVFGHQVKVNGQDFSNTPGIVVIDKHIPENTQVSRSTVGDAYTAIINDLDESIRLFDLAGKTQGSKVYFTPAAVYGLRSRVKLYLEDFQGSINDAKDALTAGRNPQLAYTPESYAALYDGGGSNTESFFYLAITSMDNWSANSCGTLWSSYSYGPNGYLQSLMADTDVRASIWSWSADSYGDIYFDSGKFSAFTYGNPAVGTNYLINAPEMYLNQAEGYLRQATPDIASAQNALLVVAKRNTAITSVADLPSTADDLMKFIQDERARELFQEGHRLWDLRRWDITANLYATGDWDEIKYMINGFKVSYCVYPIPNDEINAGFGVKQNEGWFNTFPE